MNDIFQQNMTIIAGDKAQNPNEKQLSADDKKKISDAYFKLYYGLTFANWMRGGTLANAWFQALEQVKSFISSKNAQNSAAMYMRQVNAAHNARWSKIIMTNPNKDKTVQCPPDKKQELNALINRDINQGLASLNEVLGKYAVKQNPSQMQNPQAAFISAQKKMQMMVQWQMQQHQNGGMAA